MFYLAEVVQKGKTFLGKGKIVLQLLACQQRDGWRSLINEEQIALEGYEYNPGVLLLVELAPTRDHALRLEEAQRTLVGLLQDHSRLQEQIKTKESEVEQWRESLRIQSEEVSHRQAELESRQGALSNLQAELDELASQHYDARLLRDELDQVRRDLEQKNQELATAWEQLSAGTGGEAALGVSPAHLQDLSRTLDTLLNQEGTESGGLSVLDRLKTLNVQQQTCLDRCREQLQRLSAAEGTTAEGAELHRALQVASLQHQLALLEQQRMAQQAVRLQVQQLIRSESDDFDLAAVELLPLEQLEERVQALEQESNRIMTFVNDQEEELRPQREAIQQIKVRLATADEFARLTLEGELTDAEDRYRMLDHSLVEQRRTAQQRHQTYLRHRQILDRRRGLPTPDDVGLQIDFTPVLRLLDEQQQGQQTQQHRLQAELEQLQTGLPDRDSGAALEDPSLLLAQALEESRNLQCLLGETADLFTELNRQQEVRQQLCQQIQDLLKGYLPTAATAV